jgi:hypothetical protein
LGPRRRAWCGLVVIIGYFLVEYQIFLIALSEKTAEEFGKPTWVAGVG